jgi:Uma2 family endonuclease
MSLAVLDEVEEDLDNRTVVPPEVPEGFELVDGELREILVSTESSRVSGRIFYRLENYCENQRPGWVFPEGTQFRCFPGEEKRTRRSDTAYIALDRMPPATYVREGYCTTVPDIVAEVISPHDVADDVEGKLKDWIEAGVKLVWIIGIPTRTVRCHRSDGAVQYLHESDALTAPDLLPGFSCPIADLFRLPGQPAPAS